MNENTADGASVVTRIRRWFWKLFFKYLVWAILIFGCVSAYFFYAPMWSLVPYKPNQNVQAFADDWQIKGGFRAWSTAKELALLSWIAYGDKANVKKNIKGNYKLVEEIVPMYSDQKCYFFERDREDDDTEKKIIIIVFRGSDDFSDWWDNLNCSSCKHRKEGLHSGFANRYGHFEYAIRERLIKNNPDEIWITGHSLGGALAVICAEQIISGQGLNSNEDPEIAFKDKLKGVFTFAQPMVSVAGKFNDTCKDELEPLHVHFANDNDLVPRLAPTYSHSGLMIRFNGEKDVFITPSYLKEVDLGAYLENKNPDDKKSKIIEFRQGIAATYENLRKRKSLTEKFEYGLPFKDDHSIVEYVNKINGVFSLPSMKKDDGPVVAVD